MTDLKKLHDAQTRLDDATAAVDKVRNDRDAIIYDLSTEGFTAYRLAKELDLSQQAIAKIIKKRKQTAGNYQNH